MNSMKLTFLALLTLLTATPPLLAATRLVGAGERSPLPNQTARTDLAPFGGGGIPFEFSADGRFISAFWLPHPPGDYTRQLGRTVVFGLDGKPVSDATDGEGQLVGTYIQKFPRTAWRKQFAEFVADTSQARTVLWGFSDDFSLGLRILKPKGSDFSTATAELWRFQGEKRRKWSLEVPAFVGLSHSGLVAFFETAGEQRVLVALPGMKGFVFSVPNDKLLYTFTYGKEDTEADLQARRKKFHLPDPDDDSSVTFHAPRFAFDSSRMLLACGDSNSRRIRAVTVDPPHAVVFEAHSEDNPQRPRGGVWKVTSMFFDGAGKYLIVGCSFGGGLTRRFYDPIEIFETTKWQLVWSVDDPQISSIDPPRISSDGKIMALTRGNWLEIGPFIPKSSVSEKKK